MLRLKSIKEHKPLRPHRENEPEPETVLLVTFEGSAGESGHCEITLTMRDRGNDEDQLRDARKILRDAVVALAHELQPQGVPQSP